MSCKSFVQKGPCNSGIKWGSPVRECDNEGPIVRVVYEVPADKLCCFYNHLFGDWRLERDEEDESVCMKIFAKQSEFEHYPLPCHAKIQIHPEDDVKLLPVMATTRRSEGNAGVWTEGAVDSEGMASIASPSRFKFKEKDFEDATYPPWTIVNGDNKVCWLDVDVTYRNVRVQVPDEYVVRMNDDKTGAERVTHESPLRAPYPTQFKIAKESGIDFRTADDESVVFCELKNPWDEYETSSPQGALQIILDGVGDGDKQNCPNREVCVRWSLPDGLTDLDVQIYVETPEGQDDHIVNTTANTGQRCFGEILGGGATVRVTATFLPETATLDVGVSCNKGSICCDVAPESSVSAKPITTDRIQLDWLGVPIYDDAMIKSLKGHANLDGFLGYPAYGLLFAGYDVRHRYNCKGQPVSDLSFQFICKTVPAAGEMSQYLDPELSGAGLPGGFLIGHANVNDTVGAWNRSYCATPIEGTTQHYQHVCDSQGNPLIPGAKVTGPGSFADMFVVPICEEAE